MTCGRKCNAVCGGPVQSTVRILQWLRVPGASNMPALRYNWAVSTAANT